MKHPFQILISDSSHEHIFASVTNRLMVFSAIDGKLIGSWTDPVDAREFQESRFKARIEKQSKKKEVEKAENATKRLKTNKKEPKAPAPGAGAPPIYHYIRSLTLSRNETYLIGTTNSDKAAVIFKIDYTQENCIQLITRQVFPKRLCSVLTTLDDTKVVVADKFGDVYEISAINTEAVAEKDLVPILGHVSMLNEVVVAEHDGKQYVLTGDRDEHIKVSHYPESYVVRNWLFGHHEFVSCLHICSFNKDILISGGGDDYLILWDWWANKQLARVGLRQFIAPFLTDSHLPPERFRRDSSSREISISKVTVYEHGDTRLMVVLCENTNCLLTFKIHTEMNVEHHQTFETSLPIVDFVVLSDSILAAVDIETGTDLLQLYKFDDDGILHLTESPLTKEITMSVDCEVLGRGEFYPLYPMNSFRKRGEH